MEVKNGKKISDTIDLHSLCRVRLKALWILDKYDECLMPSQIAKKLLHFGVSVSRQSIESSLSKKRGSVHKERNGYIIMEKGRQELGSVSEIKNVIFIDSNKPFSAKRSEAVKILVGSLKKEIRICDPYIDSNTLDFIFHNFNKKNSIKILTANVIDKPSGSFKRQLQEIIQEGFQIEVKIYKNSTLHDRYIMDDNNFWLSGNSFNYLGKKESFIVALGSDVRQSMLATFNSRWKISSNV